MLKTFMLVVALAHAAGENSKSIEDTTASDFDKLKIISNVINENKDDHPVKQYLDDDALFIGAKSYPFSISGFRQFLRSRKCGEVEAVDRSRVRAIAALSGRPLVSFQEQESVSGPGLWVYCVRPMGITAHELYTFRFEDGKVKRVYFTTVVVPPAPPPPSR